MQPHVEPPIKKKGLAKTHAELNKEYYARVKSLDPELHKTRLALQKERSKEYREKLKKNATESQKEEKRAKDRERQKRYRQRKEKKEKPEESKKPLTRKEREKIEQNKIKDKIRKQKIRDGWSRQKKQTESKKALVRYYKKKGMSKVLSEEGNGDKDGRIDEISDQRSGGAQRQALFRMSKALPNSPNKKQHTINEFFKKMSPNVTETSLTEVILAKDTVTSKEERAFKRLLAKKLRFRPKIAKKININIKKLQTNDVFDKRKQAKKGFD